MIWALLIAPAMALSHGEYILRAAGCIHCHTDNWEEPLAGGRALVTPFGNFYPPNITMDKETGIGRWSEKDFARAVREGLSPQGRPYYPAFPYRAYAMMSDEDVHALFTYLSSRPPIKKQRRAHEISFPFDQRWLIHFWQILYLPRPNAPQSRGEYLVEGLGHCAECHTPRNQLGALDTSRWLGGSNLRLDGRIVPNITPDPRLGLGRWSDQDWDRFLSSGIRPDGSTVGGEMASVIEGLAHLTRADRQAMIQYLRSLKPVSERVVPQ